MGILEQVIQMKNQGIPDMDIVNNLKEQGISPKEISDALDQFQIKSAVSGGAPKRNSDLEYPSQGNTDQTPYPEEDIYYPQAPTPEEYPSMQGEYYSEEPFPQEAQQEYGYESSGTDTNTLMEVAEQVYLEKTKKIQTQIEDLNEFKTLARTKIDSISERLKRIEETIDKLQVAILERVGSYGRNLESVKKEMSMMQDSFGKIINPVLDRTERKIMSKKHKKK